MKKSKKDYDYMFKLLIIGDTGVGKSCLLLRYAENEFNTNYICTIGVDFKVKTISVNGQRVKLQIWDTAGQERFRTITSTYYRGAHGIIIVYDVNENSSFVNVERWMGEANEYAEGSVARILVGNKNDDPERKQVVTKDAKRLAETNSCLFTETSAKDGVNVDLLFRNLAAEIMRMRRVEDHRQTSPNVVRLNAVSIRTKKKRSKCC